MMKKLVISIVFILVGVFVVDRLGGLVPNPKPSHYPEVLSYTKLKEGVDSTKLSFMHRFINLCQSNKIKLIFVVSPLYSKVDTNYYDVLKSIAKQYDIPFLDYHTSGLYWEHPELFRDVNHLWDKGARAYSSIFASDLKRILKH